MIARIDDHGNLQQLEDHLKQVANICSVFLRKIGFEKTGKLLGLLHDIGKYSDQFQRYIKSQAGLLKEGDPEYSFAERGTIPHAEVGAWFLEFSHKEHLNRDIAVLFEMPIAYHHGYLEDVYCPDGEAPFLQKKPSLKLNLEQIFEKIDPLIKEEIQNIILQESGEKEIKAFFCSSKFPITAFDLGTLLRLLYSALIDADRMDASGRTFVPFIGWNALIKVMETKISTFATDTPINKIREQISCTAKNAGVYSCGIYNLTIPTGGGKTFAGLRFALHHAEKNHLQRIIYAAPFLSILEQNADEIRSILDDPDGKYVLECHSNVLPEQKKDDLYSAVSENWDAPIICTSTVQILNAMFSGESRYARRFHQFSESVIIFDEVQSLPLEMLHLFSRMVNFISERMHSTVLLCSATQPQLNMINKDKGAVRFSVPQDIYPKYPDLFRQLKRVQTEYIRGIRTNNDILSFIRSRLNDVKSFLLICNTRCHAAEMFSLLKSEYPDYNVYHLSTKLCPQHRKDLISEIKSKLKSQERVIVCSTSLIEAGVNISFETVIRMMSSLDSIVQAAGRCNRNAETESGRVFILDNPLELHLTPSVSRWSSSTRNALWQYETDPEKFDNDILSPKLLEFYYRDLYFQLEQQNCQEPNLMDFPVKVGGIKEETTLLSLLGDNQQSFAAYRRRNELPVSEKKLHVCGAFRTAGSHFKALDDISAASVIVPYGKGKEIIAKLCAISDPVRLHELLKEVQLYTVNITEFEEKKLREDHAIHELSDDLRILIADETCYDSENLGLGTSQGHLSSEIF